MECGPAPNKFGEFIVKNFYDESVEFFDKLAQGSWKAPALLPLQKSFKQFSPEQLEVMRQAVIRSLGTGIHQFLFALGEAHDFDQGIAVVVDGVDVVDQSDGLHSESFGPDGWMAKYSKYPDYFAE